MQCERCKTDEANRVITKFDKELNQLLEYCNLCENISYASQGFRDAQGNKVSMSDSLIGKYSYALGSPILSKRHFANELKKSGLIQAGTAYTTGKKKPLKGE